MNKSLTRLPNDKVWRKTKGVCNSHNFSNLTRCMSKLNIVFMCSFVSKFFEKTPFFIFFDDMCRAAMLASHFCRIASELPEIFAWEETVLCKKSQHIKFFDKENTSGSVEVAISFGLRKTLMWSKKVAQKIFLLCY